MEKSMNSTFSSFDLDGLEPDISRSEHFTIRLWAKDEKMDEYSLLVDLSLSLRSLQFVGKSLEAFHHPLPQNCILLHLSDGIYTSFTDMASETQGLLKKRSHSRDVLGSSFDSLLQLANLDECIQDAFKARSKLEAEINALLSDRSAQSGQSERFTEHEQQYSTIRKDVHVEQRSIAHITRRRHDIRQGLQARRAAVADGKKAQLSTLEHEARIEKAAKLSRAGIADVSIRSQGQLKRVCKSLMTIFPIEPVKNKTLHFTIRLIHLPNSVFDDTNRDEIAAALGFTSQLVHQLSLYLSIPLPYPIEPNASESFIRDSISVALVQRKFPLHPTNVAYKFEYGVFLLNKNIEFMMNRLGLRVLDIRHTLPNLKYLLFVLTAGTGETPARKAGGIRGLLGGRAPSLSRRGSEESVLSQSNEIAGKGHPAHASRGGLVKEKDALKGLPYRRRLLRDGT